MTLRYEITENNSIKLIEESQKEQDVSLNYLSARRQELEACQSKLTTEFAKLQELEQIAISLGLLPDPDAVQESTEPDEEI